MWLILHNYKPCVVMIHVCSCNSTRYNSVYNFKTEILEISFKEDNNKLDSYLHPYILP